MSPYPEKNPRRKRFIRFTRFDFVYAAASRPSSNKFSFADVSSSRQSSSKFGSALDLRHGDFALDFRCSLPAGQGESRPRQRKYNPSREACDTIERSTRFKPAPHPEKNPAGNNLQDSQDFVSVASRRFISRQPPASVAVQKKSVISVLSV